MALLKYGFFNSVPGDERVYTQSDFANPLSVLPNGIYGGPNALEVKKVNSESVSVGYGTVLINGYWAALEDDGGGLQQIALPLPSVGDSYAKCRIIIRLDKNESGRKISVVCKTDGYGATPETAPLVALTRTAETYELSVATVIATVDGIESVNDERYNNDACGFYPTHAMSKNCYPYMRTAQAYGRESIVANRIGAITGGSGESVTAEPYLFLSADDKVMLLGANQALIRVAYVASISAGSTRTTVTLKDENGVTLNYDSAWKYIAGITPRAENMDAGGIASGKRAITSASMYNHALGVNVMGGFEEGGFICGHNGSLGNAISAVASGTASAPGNEFEVGRGFIHGTSPYITVGADYAEMFEWSDGNPSAEDRIGRFVTLDGEKIRTANEGDYVVGIITGNPSILGDSAPTGWNGRYLRDDFNRIIWETVEEDGLLNRAPKVNPNYDIGQQYEPRNKRPEWAAVGMMGKLAVYDDGTCQTNGYCRCTDEGKATASDEGYRVLKRISDNIVLILFK